MCGINGIFGFNDTCKAQEEIVAMNTHLSHRGPDDEGLFLNEGICLGHKRLAILDLSRQGQQPMTDATGRYTIVYNGEVYNYLDIKHELKNYPFQSSTDTEVVLAAFSRWGLKCLDRLNGMFAFGIWDGERKELLIARDRMGIKPLYYYHKENVLYFSSEIRALMSVRPGQWQLNMDSLSDYLRFQTVHAPETIVKDIFSLLPGHTLVVNKETVEDSLYWEPDFSNPVDEDYATICGKVKEHLYNAVEMRLVSDVPFGAFLSGGIDSSAVVGIMSEVMQQKPSTFSVVFDENRYDESGYSLQVAKRFNTDHHPILLKADDCLEMMPSALSSMDHPGGDGPNTWLVSKMTKAAGITVALSGLGGDELFAGYNFFTRLQGLDSKKLLLNAPLAGRKILASLIRLLKRGMSGRKIGALLDQERIDLSTAYALSRQVLLDDDVVKLLLTSPQPNRVGCIVGALQKEAKYPIPFLSKVSLAEIHTYLQNVLLRDTDQMSMAHALELRVPFLDHLLVEYVLRIPDHFKQPVTPKKLLTDALGTLLPQDIINRPKMGFTFPWERWMRAELLTFCDTRMRSLAGRGCFRKEAVLDMWYAFRKGSRKHSWSHLWPLVVLENWIEDNDLRI